MKYNGFEVNDELIDKYVESLEISIDEACQLILEEEGKIKPSAETEKAQNVREDKRRYERSEKPRKKTEKVARLTLKKATLLVK